MSGKSWAASGKGPARPSSRVRPAGSWSAAVERSRLAWDGLAGGPTIEYGPGMEPGQVVVLGPDDDAPVRLVYSEWAAGCILDTALGLWSDVAASMGEDGEE